MKKNNGHKTTKMKKIIGLAKPKLKEKVHTYEVDEVIEVKVMVPAEPKMINIEFKVTEEVTIDDIYKKLKEKTIGSNSTIGTDGTNTIVKSTVKPFVIPSKQIEVTLESSLKDTNLKDDVFFKIKTKKDFKNLWEPLDSLKVKSFMNFCKNILSKNNLEFKVSSKIIETLKIFSYIKNTDDDRLKKFIITDDEISDILCVRIYEETLKIQKDKLLDRYVIIPLFKTYVYGKYIKDLYQDYINIKWNIDNLKASPYDLERKMNSTIKWLLFDSDICMEIILEKAFEYYLKEKIKEPAKITKSNSSGLILGLILHIKNSSMVLYKSRTNLENTFMENRIRRIRNILSRNESNLFHLKLEDVIRLTMDRIRSNKSLINFGDVRCLDIFDILIDIENGKHLKDYLKRAKKGK